MKTKVKVLLLCCLLWPCCIQAQELSDGLRRIKEVCLSVCDGVSAKDKYTVMEGIDAIRQFQWFKRSNFKRMEPAEEPPLKGHLQFESEFLDSLLLYDFNFELVPCDVSLMRRPASVRYYYNHSVLPAFGTGLYRMEGMGQMELVVVPEPGGRLNLHMEDETNHLLLNDEAEAGKASCQLVWQMERRASFLLRVENKTDRPVSFILVTN